MDILLKDIHVVSPEDKIDTVTDILIIDGIIEQTGRGIKYSSSVEVLDMKNKTGVPGFYDMHVHFREPGQIHKEDITSGSKAAANGGFTGVLCMPNTAPPIDSPMLLKNLMKKGEGNIVDIDYAACATAGRQGEQLSPILSLAEAGAKAFTDDGSPVANAEIMRRALEYTSQVNSVMIQHCEDMALSNKGVMNEGFISTASGLKGIPEISETIIIARDILLTQYLKNSRYHIQHISCGASVDLVRQAKLQKLNVTAEVCPHHFILTEKECSDYDTNAKMNPPLRTEKDIEKILEGLSDDTIDVICTDHAPHTEYEKSQGFYDAPFGIVGLETAVGLAYTFLVTRKIISFKKLVEKMSVNPRRILGMTPVKIKTGEKANITVLDLNKSWRVNKNRFKSKSINTPFNNLKLSCMPYCVINNNRLYYSNL